MCVEQVHGRLVSGVLYCSTILLYSAYCTINGIFGIDERGSLVSDLPTYSADAGIKDVGTELYSVVSFSERSGILVRYAYNRLLNDAADSPVVTVDGSRDQVFVGIGYFRRF